MKRIFFITLFFFLFLINSADAKQLRILTTTADIKSIVQFIGKDRVTVDSLADGKHNYHFLSAKPSYMVQAKKADLFVRSGFELEVGYESLILEGSRNKNIQVGKLGHLDASYGVKALDIPNVVDRSLGDIHPSGNPHYWLDPLNAKIMASNIAHRLSELSPEDSVFFKDNLSEFNSRIDAKMEEWQALLLPYQGEKLISYHQSWAYFAERFGLKVAGQLEPKPGVPPSPTHLKKLVSLVHNEDIKIILSENIYNTDAARFISDRTRAKVVGCPISVGGQEQAWDYFSLIDTIVKKIVGGFQL